MNLKFFDLAGPYALIENDAENIEDGGKACENSCPLKLKERIISSTEIQKSPEVMYFLHTKIDFLVITVAVGM